MPHIINLTPTARHKDSKRAPGFPFFPGHRKLEFRYAVIGEGGKGFKGEEGCLAGYKLHSFRPSVVAGLHLETLMQPHAPPRVNSFHSLFPEAIRQRACAQACGLPFLQDVSFSKEEENGENTVCLISRQKLELEGNGPVEPAARRAIEVKHVMQYGLQDVA